MKRLVILQHVEREGPSLFKDIAIDYGLDVITHKVFLGDCIPKIRSGDIFLALGGPMSIKNLSNNSHKWLNDELDLIRNLLQFNIPFIGVCLGAQLLAYAAGGTVEKLFDKTSNKPIAEIGWDPVVFNNKYFNTEKTSLEGNSINVLHWHEDRINLPPNAHLLASSKKCREQMFFIGKKAIGLQFHPEIVAQDVIRWIDEDELFVMKGLGNNGREILLEQNTSYCDRSHKSRVKFIGRIFEYFEE